MEKDNINVRVTATNFFGTSDPSIITGVRQMETVPHKPLTAPMRGNLTSQKQVQVFIDSL